MRGSAAEDRRLLTDMVDQYGSAVRAFFARRVRNADDVEDLSQEVFVRLLKRADLDAIENPQGYLFHIAASVLADRHRLMGRRISTVSDADDFESAAGGEELSPERVLLGKEAYERMVRALLALPERTRMIVVLNRYELMSAPEIAKHLGLSVSLVSKEMMRATALLRDSVK